MSDTVPAAPEVDLAALAAGPAPDVASVKGRLAARRKALREKKPFDLPVPGYEDSLVARYHALDYRVQRGIGIRQETNSDQADAEVKVAADTLVTACEDLLEKNEDGTLTSLGRRWTFDTARDYFDVGLGELPDGSTARDALLKIIDPIEVVIHYAAFDRRSRTAGEAVDREMRGESDASPAV